MLFLQTLTANTTFNVSNITYRFEFTLFIETHQCQTILSHLYICDFKLSNIALSSIVMNNEVQHTR